MASVFAPVARQASNAWGWSRRPAAPGARGNSRLLIVSAVGTLPPLDQVRREKIRTRVRPVSEAEHAPFRAAIRSLVSNATGPSAGSSEGVKRARERREHGGPLRLLLRGSGDEGKDTA